MGLDEDAIQFRKWQPTVEQRLAALESRSSPPLAPREVAPAVDFGSVEASIRELQACVASQEARINEVTALLAGVEAALGTHGHPPSPPVEPMPLASTAASGVLLAEPTLPGV